MAKRFVMQIVFEEGTTREELDKAIHELATSDDFPDTFDYSTKVFEDEYEYPVIYCP